MCGAWDIGYRNQGICMAQCPCRYTHTWNFFLQWCKHCGYPTFLHRGTQKQPLSRACAVCTWGILVRVELWHVWCGSPAPGNAPLPHAFHLLLHHHLGTSSSISTVLHGQEGAQCCVQAVAPSLPIGARPGRGGHGHYGGRGPLEVCVIVL